ncbi:MAG: hypothetical protein ACI9R3_004527 [Verrucomicrobiales bacterium]|jgi:hypothetical protein
MKAGNTRQLKHGGNISRSVALPPRCHDAGEFPCAQGEILRAKSDGKSNFGDETNERLNIAVIGVGGTAWL